MSPIEPLEPRIAPAAGLTIANGAAGTLTVNATEAADSVAFRSDEPGWLTVAVGTGDILVDGLLRSNPVTIPMPRGAVTINMLGGEDLLLLNPMTVPGSLTINDLADAANIAMTGLVVKGALVIKTGSGDDTITADGRLSVGKDLTISLGTGASDGIYNTTGGLALAVGGSLKITGAADATAVALGLDFTGAFAREIGDPLALRELRVGKDFIFDVAKDAALLLASASTQIKGRFDVRAAGADSNLDFFSRNTGPMSVGGGLQIQSGSAVNTYIAALSVTIGKALTVTSGGGEDFVTIFGNNTMKLPKTSLAFGEGPSAAFIQAHDTWTLGSLSVTAGDGEDSLTLAGPGKVTGSVIGDFGTGRAFALASGEGVGRINLGPLVKFTSDTQMITRLYSANLAGRVEVTGNSGSDALFFDSVRVTGPVIFNAGAGEDYFWVDGRTEEETTEPVYLPLFFTPSVFVGPVSVDLGADADVLVLGQDLLSGRAGFQNTVSIRGVMGETAFVASSQSVTFKKQPMIG